jgi:hypothetical protein
MYKLYKNINGLEANAVLLFNANGSVTCIPFDPANTDYAKFKKDLANGAELQDADGNVIDGIAYLKELS